MQRAYDQVIHDVALQNLNVVFCLDRGGLVGADGATHHGTYDIAYFECIPNMIVSAPMNESELRNLMFTAQLPNQGPFSIRYPRGNGVLTEWRTPLEEINIGVGRKISDGENIAILSIGHPGNFVQEAQRSLKEGLSIAHYDMRFVKPLDEELLHIVFKKFANIITIEDGCVLGGFGSAILEFMSNNNYNSRVIRLGIPDKFIHHGTQNELHIECNYDTKAIVTTVHKILEKKPSFTNRLNKYIEIYLIEMNIKNILNGLIENSTVRVKGWVRNKRGSKQTSFISINDGSTINSLQIVAEEIVITEETIKNITIRSSICVEGKIVKSIGSEQSFEVLANKIDVLGPADPKEYPLQPKKHSLEFLRDKAHLRFRTNTFSAVFRLRHALTYYT